MATADEELLKLHKFLSEMVERLEKAKEDKPREFWIEYDPDNLSGFTYTVHRNRSQLDPTNELIHVREVVDE